MLLPTRITLRVDQRVASAFHVLLSSLLNDVTAAECCEEEDSERERERDRKYREKEREGGRGQREGRGEAFSPLCLEPVALPS